MKLAKEAKLAKDEKLAKEVKEGVFCGWGEHKAAGAFLWEEMGGVPSKKDESWKFTPLGVRGEGLVRVYEGDGCEDVDVRGRYGDKVEREGWWGVDIVNGKMRGEGLSLCRGAEVIRGGKGEAEALLVSYFGQVVVMEGRPIVALNTMYTDEVLVVHVGEGVKVEKPIVLSMIARGGMTVTSRVLLVMGEGSECTLIEDFSAWGDEGERVVPVVEVVVGARSRCYHYKNQAMGEKDVHLATTGIVVEREALYERVVCQTGSLISRDELDIHVIGEDVQVNVGGVYIGKGEQCLDQTILLHHKVPNVVSRQEYRGILTGSARGVFQGKIKVDRVAQKTDGYQVNRTVILSDDAWMHAKPELEIYADDVKCSHGAVMGELNKQAMYYLRSRGLTKARARDLLLMAHVNEVLGGVSHEEVREDFGDWLGEVLSGVRV